MSPLQAAERRSIRSSPFWKLFVIGFLILLLWIPLGIVRSLISEREGRRSSVANEVAATWGYSQTLGGPVLTGTQDALFAEYVF